MAKWQETLRGGGHYKIYDPCAPYPNMGKPIHGTLQNGSNWVPMAWAHNGRAFGVDAGEHPWDLVEKKRARFFKRDGDVA